MLYNIYALYIYHIYMFQCYLSHSIPPSPSPTVFTSLFSMSASLLLPWSRFFSTIFLDSIHTCCCASSVQSCPTLCNPMAFSLLGSTVHGIFQARILEWVAMPLLQGIFPTQESNWDLLHCRWILYQPSYEGSPYVC